MNPIFKKNRLVCGFLGSPGGASLDVVFKAETLAYLSAKILMDYLL